MDTNTPLRLPGVDGVAERLRQTNSSLTRASSGSLSNDANCSLASHRAELWLSVAECATLAMRTLSSLGKVRPRSSQSLDDSATLRLIAFMDDSLSYLTEHEGVCLVSPRSAAPILWSSFLATIGCCKLWLAMFAALPPQELWNRQQPTALIWFNQQTLAIGHKDLLLSSQIQENVEKTDIDSSLHAL